MPTVVAYAYSLSPREAEAVRLLCEDGLGYAIDLNLRNKGGTESASVQIQMKDISEASPFQFSRRKDLRDPVP